MFLVSAVLFVYSIAVHSQYLLGDNFPGIFNNEFPHYYECIFETCFIGDKMQNTTVKRFVKVGYNVNFEFHETVSKLIKL